MRLHARQFGFAGVVISSGLVLTTFTTGFFVSQSALLEPSNYNQPYHHYTAFEYDALDHGYQFACITGSLTLVRPRSINHNNMADVCDQFGLVALAN